MISFKHRLFFFGGLFLLGSCVLFPAILVSGTFIARDVTISMQGLSAQEQKSVKVLRTNFLGRAKPLYWSADSGLWFSTHSWARDLVVEAPGEVLGKIRGIDVSIGSNRYLLAPADFSRTIRSAEDNLARADLAEGLRQNGLPAPRFGLLNFQWKWGYSIGCLAASVFLVLLACFVISNCGPHNAAAGFGTTADGRDIRNGLILFLAAVALTGVFAVISVDPFHDGIMLKPALDVAKGKALFRETFTQYGALTVGLQAIAVKIGGESLVSIRLLTAFFYGLIAVLLYFIHRRYLSRSAAVLSVVLWMLLTPFLLDYPIGGTMQPWSSVYALLFQLAAIYWAVRYLETERSVFLLLSSGAAALTFLCRQPVGVFLVAALFFSLCTLSFVRHGVKRTVREMAFLTTGIAIVGMLFLAYLVRTDAVSDWFRQSLKLAYQWGGIGLGWQTAKELAVCLFVIHPSIDQIYPINYTLWPWRVIPAVSLLLFGWIAYMLFVKRMRSLEYQTMFVITCAALSSWFQYFPVVCQNHLFWAATPMMGALFYTLSKSLSFVGCKKRLAAYFVVVTLVFGWDVSTKVASGFKKGVDGLVEMVPVSGPRILKGMRIEKDWASEYENLSRAIDGGLAGCPSRTIVNLGGDAFFSALAPGRPNAHPLYVNWGDLLTNIYPSYYSEIAAFIAREGPLVLVPFGNYPGRLQMQPVLEEYGYRPLAVTRLGFSVMAPPAPCKLKKELHQ